MVRVVAQTTDMPHGKPHFRDRPVLFEALGRLLLALRTMHCRDSMPSLDYWVSIDGHLALEWFHGAHASEIAERLVVGSHDSEVGELRDGQVTGSWSFAEDAYTVNLVVRGVRVQLRGCEPIGFEEAQRAAFQRVLARS